MGEDMTYEPVQTVAQLAARVAELERALAQADSNMVALAERNAELAARLDAVPDYVDYRRGYTDWDTGVFSFGEWCERFLAVQP